MEYESQAYAAATSAPEQHTIAHQSSDYVEEGTQGANISGAPETRAVREIKYSGEQQLEGDRFIKLDATKVSSTSAVEGGAIVEDTVSKPLFVDSGSGGGGGERKPTSSTRRSSRQARYSDSGSFSPPPPPQRRTRLSRSQRGGSPSAASRKKRSESHDKICMMREG